MHVAVNSLASGRLVYCIQYPGMPFDGSSVQHWWASPEIDIYKGGAYKCIACRNRISKRGPDTCIACRNLITYFGLSSKLGYRPMAVGLIAQIPRRNYPEKTLPKQFKNYDKIFSKKYIAYQELSSISSNQPSLTLCDVLWLYFP